MFTFKSTAEVDPLDNVIGQERAVQAIEFGLRKINHYQRHRKWACQKFIISGRLVHGQ